MTACGCGEERIPWMLTKFGLLGTAGLALGLLVAMILAGWLLVAVVSLARRGRGPGRQGTADDSGPGSLDGFSWRAEDP